MLIFTILIVLQLYIFYNVSQQNVTLRITSIFKELLYFKYFYTTKSSLIFPQMTNSPIISVRNNIYQYRKGMLHRIVVCNGQIETRQIIIVNVEGRYMRCDIH